MMVWGMMAVGRGIGGFIHYKVHLPVQRKFVIALFVYITLSLLEGSYLYFPVFDDDKCIAQVAQALEGFQELVVIPLMAGPA